MDKQSNKERKNTINPGIFRLIFIIYNLKNEITNTNNAANSHNIGHDHIPPIPETLSETMPIVHIPNNTELPQFQPTQPENSNSNQYRIVNGFSSL